VTDVDGCVPSVELDQLHGRIAGRFRRAEPRNRARQYLSGLIAGLDRTNGWTLAEQAGEVSPDGMQRLLRWADWDIDAVRDDIRDYVVEHLAGPQAVLIVDDAGFPKKGLRSAGVARQYSRTAGRIENCQIGVFLAYSSAIGHALIDRQLYLPRAWTDDRDRRRAAGVPDEVKYWTKPQIARTMLSRALDAGVPVGWVTAGEAYGQATSLRVWLEDHDVAHVLATHRNDTVITTEELEERLDELVAARPTRSWCRISAGVGADGQSDYDWIRVPVRVCWQPGRGYWVLARRSVNTGEIDHYICYGPRRTSLVRLAAIASTRKAIEECVQQAKNTAGLCDYQARSWRAWHAHITLSMAAHALLVIAALRTSCCLPTGPRKGTSSTSSPE
jgi:SRSO17 transposase